MDGRTHPELIPDAVAWQWALRVLEDAARADPTLSLDEAIEGLGRYTLFVSAEDARTIIQTAATALDTFDALRKEPEDGRTPWSVATRKARHGQADIVILSWRDRVKGQLSTQAYRALER